jgi:hypothetical protein
MKEIKPTEVKYIKLGRGGEWEEECIEKTQTVRIGFREVDHALCLAKNWQAIKGYYEGKGRKAGPSTGFVNQIKDFYEADASVLWITFYKRLLWWCFSEPAITLLPDHTKARPAVGGWKSESIDGKTLDVDHLSGKLLRVQGFRGTICGVVESDYVLKKINGQELTPTTQAREALRQLCESVKPLIQHLHWKDFEILVDLIFRQAGWQRVGVIGKTEKDIDIELLSPVLSQRCFVQIKSSSSVGEFEY